MLFTYFSGCVNIGSKFYFLGGTRRDLQDPTTVTRRVHVIDIDDPILKLRSLAPMHTSKDSLCVFVADAMIYALNSPPRNCFSEFPSKRSGFFERYHPISDSWEVLPDPPSFHLCRGAKLLDCATVIGRRVFIGCPYFHAIFNLDSLTWDQSLSPDPANQLFPYGSIFVQQQQSASLYHVAGPGVIKRGSIFGCFGGNSPVVKRIPLPTPKQQGVYDSTLLTYPGGKERIMAESIDLDENKFFTKKGFFALRELLHVGGRFFCYIVTAQLYDHYYDTRLEHCSRALLIKFFEEVPVDNHHSTIFRPVASFCYKIKTNFINSSGFMRCSVIGTVPDSWINSPPKKKQESKLKSVNREMDFITRELSLVMALEQEKCEPENTENDDSEIGDLKKLIAAHKAQISILEEELAKKGQLLKT